MRPFAVCLLRGLSFSLASLPLSAIAEIIVIPASRDAFVRDGTYSTINYGSVTALAVKGAAGTGYNRESYFYFPLPTNLGPVVSATFEATVAVGGTNVSSTTLSYTSPAWTEAGLTWNNRPSALGVLATIPSPLNSITVPLSNFAGVLAVSSSAASIKVSNAVTSAENFKSFASRESGNPARLVIATKDDYQNVVRPRNHDAFLANEAVTIHSSLLPGKMLDRVEFRLNGVLLGQDTQAPFEWTLPAGTLAQGTHELVLSGYSGPYLVDKVTRTFSVGGLQPLAEEFAAQPSPRLTDWGTAGYRMGVMDPPYPAISHDVTTYGAIANDGVDDTAAVQTAIDAAVSAGGGVVYFPPGQFDFFMPTSLPRSDILKISGSNVVLRGSGNGPGGTVLKQWDTYAISSGFQRYYLIRMGTSMNYRGNSIPFAVDAPKGASSIVLTSNSGINQGDLLELNLISPNDANGNRLPDLMLDLVYPVGTLIPVESSWTGFLRFAPFTFRAEVVGVGSDGQTVHLATPLPRAMTIGFGARARIAGTNVIKECGVENLIIRGNYADGAYSHHASWEADYGWCGVGIFASAHCWVRDVAFEKMNNDVLATQSLHCTIDRISSSGRGHYGVQFNATSSSVMSNVTFYSERTHHASVIDSAVANVFTGLVNLASKPGLLDGHGGSPSIANLYENSIGFRIGSGGAAANMPHMGKDNTFWNIEAGPKETVDDMFTHGYYNYSGGQSPYSGTDLHQLYPSSLLIGIVSPTSTIKVDGSTANRNDAWLYVNSVGAKVVPLSLLQFQRRLRQP